MPKVTIRLQGHFSNYFTFHSCCHNVYSVLVHPSFLYLVTSNVEAPMNGHFEHLRPLKVPEKCHGNFQELANL